MRKAREEGRLRADRSELLAPTHRRLVTEFLIRREICHRRTNLRELGVMQHAPNDVADVAVHRAAEEPIRGPGETTERVTHVEFTLFWRRFPDAMAAGSVERNRSARGGRPSDRSNTIV